MKSKTLAILAGGKSSRMNYNNKALIKYKEEEFIKHIIKAGRDFDEIIIISNDSKIYEFLNLRVYPDKYLNKGPLGGIHSALLNANNPYVLCIACDMPLIDRETLNSLYNEEENYEILVSKSRDRLQPLCSIYSKAIIKDIENALLNDERKLQKVISKFNYKIIDKDFNESNFLNINSPGELKELEEL